MKRRSFLLGAITLPALALPNWSLLRPRSNPSVIPTPKLVSDHREKRRTLFFGGGGAGKTRAIIMSSLMMLRLHGRSGVIVAPSHQRLVRNIWLMIRDLCPPDWVVPRHRYRFDPRWSPGVYPMLQLEIQSRHKGVTASLFLAGTQDYINLHSLNCSFAAFDDVNPYDKEHVSTLKTLEGRVRVPGPNGDIPKIYVSSDRWVSNWWPYKIEPSGFDIVQLG